MGISDKKQMLLSHMRCLLGYFLKEGKRKRRAREKTDDKENFGFARVFSPFSLPRRRGKEESESADGHRHTTICGHLVSTAGR